MSKRILLVGNFLSHSNGTAQVCEELALRLPDAGCRVLCTSSKLNRVARLCDMLWTTWRKRREFTLAHVDVFSGRAFCWAEIVCWTLRRIGKPYVLTLHGGNLPEFARRHARRVARLLHSARAITAPSAYLQERMRCYCSEVLLLPNPLELSNYEFIPRERARPNLTWLRAFSRMYNPTLAIEVLASLMSQFPDVRLTMVGPDKGDGSLAETRHLAAELGVADRIAFPGGISKKEVPAWISRGDIFLNTTNVDNTPVSVLEAMACGLCIVSTDVGGIPYLLRHEHDALLVPPNDSVAMAAAVTRLLTEPTLAARLSHSARRGVQEFDWSVVLPQWHALLSRAIDGRLP